MIEQAIQRLTQAQNLIANALGDTAVTWDAVSAIGDVIASLPTDLEILEK